MTAARNSRKQAPADVSPQSHVSAVPPADDQAADEEVSYNLNGQKLGRKGRGTRDRILAAAGELLADPEYETISMSAVARKASLGMTSLYNYFADLTELLVAVLEPVMAESEDAFLGMLRERWPDEELGDRCYAFLRAYYDYWNRNTRLLHLRNAMADSRDQRMLVHRVRGTQPIIALLVFQMDGDPEDRNSPVLGMATVLMTGIERTVTVSTDYAYTTLFGTNRRREPDHYLRPEARLLEMGIRDMRQRMAQS